MTSIQFGTVKEFRKACRKVCQAASNPYNLPSLSLIQFELSENKLKMTAADGYLLAMYSRPVKYVGEGETFYLPAAELKRNLPLGDTNDPLTITLADSQVQFNDVTIPLAETPHFPDCDRIFPDTYIGEVVFDHNDIRLVLETFQGWYELKKRDYGGANLSFIVGGRNTGLGVFPAKVDEELIVAPQYIAAYFDRDSIATFNVSYGFFRKVLRILSKGDIHMRINAQDKGPLHFVETQGGTTFHLLVMPVEIRKEPGKRYAM